MPRWPNEHPVRLEGNTPALELISSLEEEGLDVRVMSYGWLIVSDLRRTQTHEDIATLVGQFCADAKVLAGRGFSALVVPPACDPFELAATL